MLKNFFKENAIYNLSLSRLSAKRSLSPFKKRFWQAFQLACSKKWYYGNVICFGAFVQMHPIFIKTWKALNVDFAENNILNTQIKRVGEFCQFNTRPPRSMWPLKESLMSASSASCFWVRFCFLCLIWMCLLREV